MTGHGPVGRTKDAGWQIGISRTVELPVEAVWDLLTAAEGTALWLGDGVRLAPEPGTPYQTADGTVGETRSFRPYDRLRLTWQPPDWDHETTVQIAVRPAGSGRTMIRFHQERMAGAQERDRQRSHWKAVLDRVVAALAASAALDASTALDEWAGARIDR